MAKNQLKGGVILSYTNLFLLTTINIIYTPFMLRLLGQSEFGIYSLCSSVVSYLGVLNFGFGSAYAKYYSKMKAQEDKNSIGKLNGMFLSIFIAIAVIILLCGIGLVSNAERILGNKITGTEMALAKVLLFIMIINLVISMLSSVFSSIITMHERFIFQKSVELIKTICNPFLTLPLLIWGYGSVAVITVVTLFTIISLVINIVYCLKLLHAPFHFYGFDWKLLKDMYIYSFFIFLQIVMDQINWQIDKFIIGRYSGSISVAVFAIGAQINTYYLQFSTTISNVFTPKVHRMVAEKKSNEEITNLFIKVARVQIIIVLFVFTAFLFFGRDFVHMWAGKNYDSAYLVALLLMSPIIIPLTQNVGIEIVRAKNLHKSLYCIYMLGCIGNIIISIPLCKAYAEIGSAIGTSITMLIMQVFVTNIYYHKVVGINIIKYFSSILRILPGITLPCAFGIFIYTMINTGNVLSFMFWVMIYMIVYFGCIWKLFMNQEEKATIKKLSNRLRV